MARAVVTPSSIMAPSSIMRRTSSHSMGSVSGCGTFAEVVPRIDTLSPGTTMSPSPGLWQRLIAACPSRRESTTIVPLTGTTLTSTPRRCATNPAQDAPFLDALDGGLLVVDAVPAARVQQPVRASRGARGEVAFLDQDRIDAAQRQVAKHPGARRPTPDDDNARAGVRHSRERGKDQRGPFPSS